MTNNTIGGTTVEARNVISGNGWDGVHIIGSGTTGNVVVGDYIGTDVSGSQPLGNAASGVAVFNAASKNLIGGVATGAGNTISANAGYGVYISDEGTVGNVVVGDYIGTDASGTHALGNGNDGVIIQSLATNNTIGGTNPADGNVISANDGYGVHVTGASAEDNPVLDNTIGTDLTGTIVLANSRGGVEFDNSAANNTFGGSDVQ